MNSWNYPDEKKTRKVSLLTIFDTLSNTPDIIIIAISTEAIIAESGRRCSGKTIRISEGQRR